MVSDPVLGRVVPPVGGCWLSAATMGVFGEAVVLVVVVATCCGVTLGGGVGGVQVKSTSRRPPEKTPSAAEPHTDRDRAAQFEWCRPPGCPWAPADRSTSGTVTWLAEAIKMSLFGWTEALFSPVTVTSHALPTFAGSTLVVLTT